MMPLWSRTISRRDLLKGAATVGLGAAAAACAPTGVSQQGATGGGNANKSLRILQWSHFIPAYDTWIDGFVKDWGQRNKVAASIDHINTYDLPTRIASEAAAQAGHDMIEMNAQILTYLYEKDLVDMSDVVEYAEKKLGPVEPVAKKVAYVNGRWLGWVDFYIAIMPIVRTDLVQQYGFSLDKLKTWNDYMNMAAVAKSNGHAAGLAISHCNDSNHNWRAIMYSFGASIVEADGKTIAVDKPEFRQFLEFAQEFYTRANTPEVFAWDDASDNRWLDSGQGVYIHDAISSMRSVESTNPDLYKNLALMPPEAGPAHPDGLTVVDPNCYIIWKWSKNQQAAKEFLKHYIDNYHEAFIQSQLYNMPTHANPWKNQLWTDPAYGGKWAEPKLAPLQQVRGDRIAVFGYPGNPNYAANQVLAQYILPDTVATAVKTPGSAGIDAALKFIKQKLNTIYVS